MAEIRQPIKASEENVSPQPLPKKRSSFTEEELNEARRNLSLAFEEAGLLSGDGVVCPACRETHAKGKFKLNSDRGTYVCFKAKSHQLEYASGDSILLMTKFASD